MKESRQSTDFINKALLCILICVSCVVAVIKVMTGFDIDEAYALAMPYRLVQGDSLFLDMWEVHQTSAFLPYLFIKVFSLFSKDMTGLVLYMRCVTTVLHFGMSLFVFLTGRNLLQKKANPVYAALLAFIYCNFLPKWMINMDFSMQQLWFFTLFTFFLLKGMGRADYEGKKKRSGFLFLAGILLALDVLAYPGMLILYPAALVLLYCPVSGRQTDSDEKLNRKHKWIYDAIWLTFGCITVALCFFLYVLSYMSLSELLAAVPKIFMDGAHQYDVGTKLALYAAQWLEIAIQTVILTVPALCISVLIFFAAEKYNRKLPFWLLFFLIFEIETAVLIVCAGFFVTWGPFRLQVRYIIQFAMAGILLLHERNKYEKAFSKLWWLSLSAFVGVLLASNVGPSSSASYLVIGNLLFVCLTVLSAEKYTGFLKRLSYLGAVLFLMSLFMCKGFYMRNTEYVPGDITQGLCEIKKGPLAGIYVRNEDYQRLVSDYQTIKQNTTKDDRMLFLGTEVLSNLYTNGKAVSPTTISTPAFNEQWVEYFTLHPQKNPTVIFIAKNTIDNREKFFVQNPFGIWIAKYYDIGCMEETESLCILRLPE